MKLCLETILATLCVLGLTGTAWWLLGRTFKPISERKVRILVPGYKSGDHLEQTVRGFLWLRSLGILTCPIVIVDVDLDTQGYEVAFQLAAKWPGIYLWPLAHLPCDLEHLYKQK